ncbi:ATP synthase subunit A [Marinitoga sp. 1135]|uniref:V-type ATP synthase subunit A n=1 Tax=unclassified Marinitoga TaxID=2640159 RepID=UPI0009505039|nr:MULTISPECIES: V-type ATP synthase subunit A [unclassified Marinitoga]APT75507.1 ATP synthase subunit A [Marinitoga sp. 1137]NUU95229.1 ATP synthase subunit A [Marinitoga sp. 1135]NUU97162.1 ATP synthase subunit A [Marinitoga sp. 1138]
MQIKEINGPVVKVKDAKTLFMNEMVRVGNYKLIGEVIGIDGDIATVQVYEETSMLKPGEPVESTGKMLSVALGPGLLSSIYDGIQRPLNELIKKSGSFIGRGIDAFGLDTNKYWEVKIIKKQGDLVEGGEVIAEVQETEHLVHKIMVSPNLSGKIVEIVNDGNYKVTDIIAKIEDNNGNIHEIKLYQEWPVKVPRPVKKRLEPSIPLVTGQRVIDIFFPISKGGTAAIPGGFGTGKTITQHQLAKWSDADIIVYIGCGERGNEMTEVLEEFPQLKDPRTGAPLMNRTVLIANTSNMPVSAREASIYTGITIAEYFRDMGYNVAIMADSTSRWAEALRELSGRLEEMPAEEGYPSYLASRIGQFYERAGISENLNGTKGSITIIGAVSPPGGDFSEPVTQNTRRFVKCFWGLDKNLAYSRHYPSINWLTSYSEYTEDLNDWFKENVKSDWNEYRDEAMKLLTEDDRLQQIIKIVGEDVLPDNQKLTVLIAKMIKIGILQQSAFSEVDSYCPLEKQYYLLKIIMDTYQKAKKYVDRSIALSQVLPPEIISKLLTMKEEIKEIKEFEGIEKMLDEHFEKLESTYHD